MRIYESSEDYLEAILMLHEKNGYVRAVDIANTLHFSKPSVSIAMKKLRENGYILVDENNMIFLTDAGREIAERVYERHCMLRDLFIAMGVSPQNAQIDACRVEHDLCAETWARIKEYAKRYAYNPDGSVRTPEQCR